MPILIFFILKQRILIIVRFIALIPMPLIKSSFLGKTDPLTKEFLWIIVKLLKSCEPVIAPRVKDLAETYEVFLEKFREELQLKPEAIWTFHRCVGQK